jgi:hypothetical protein
MLFIVVETCFLFLASTCLRRLQLAVHEIKILCYVMACVPCVIACHVWPRFRTPRGSLGSKFARHSFLPSSPCLAVSISEVCGFHVPVPFFSSPPLPVELPPDTRSEDVSKFFDGYGKIIDCRVMTGQSRSLLFALETYPEFH